MMSDFRVVVIVSPDISDIYFANYLMDHLNVVAVVVEQQRQAITSPRWKKALGMLSRPVMLFNKVAELLLAQYRRLFSLYDKPENRADFGEMGRNLVPRGDCEVLYTTGVNAINSPEYVEWVRARRPDVIAVCGASIFKEPLIDVPREGVLNLHGGLSQRYRGLFTTDWAVHNEEPEYVGGTVHYVNPGIDEGDIVFQARPHIAAGDNPNSLYVKVVNLGVQMMVSAIDMIEQGTIKSSPLPRLGTLYLGSQFDARRREITWKKLESGVLIDYLNNKKVRDKPVDSLIINEFKLGI